MAHALNIESIPQNTSLIKTKEEESPMVSLNDPTILIMTDFKKNKILTVEPSEKIDNASEKMIAYKVRLLFVIEDNKLLGLITSTDILGQKPVLFLTERGGTRDDITVKDIMTTSNLLEAVSIKEMQESTVGDVIETLRKVNRQHMLVLDYDAENLPVIRGLLSMTKASKQTGETINTDGRANSLAELGAERGYGKMISE